MNIPPISA